MTPEDSDDSPSPSDEPYSREIQQTEPASIAVVRAIAAVEDVPVNQLDPLAAAIDPDALDGIVARGASVTLEFEYVGYRVTVDSGSVTVRDADDT